jgi:hypothetical protein
MPSVEDRMQTDDGLAGAIISALTGLHIALEDFVLE